MGRGKTKEKKDGFEDLDEVFKAEAQAADDVRLREIISKNAVNREVAAEAMKADPDVKETADAAKEAKRPYNDTIKFCKLRVQYCRKVANDRGRPLPGTEGAK